MREFQMAVATSVIFFLPRIALDELLYFTVDEIDYVWTKNQF